MRAHPAQIVGVLALVVSAALLSGPAAEGAVGASTTEDGWGPLPHSRPIEAEVHDPWRAPDHQFGPGNRGIEYDSAPGATVRASQAGRVTFAGAVAGVRWVTVRHSGRLRTTVGPLESIDVAVGESVGRGDLVGRASGRLHFSARLDGDYIDPALLFGPMQVVVRLVHG